MQNSRALKVDDFSYLDQPDFGPKFISGVQENQIRFFVGGLRCGKCVRKLEGLALSLPGLLRMQVDLGKNIASAEVDRNFLTFKDLAVDL